MRRHQLTIPSSKMWTKNSEYWHCARYHSGWEHQDISTLTWIFGYWAYSFERFLFCSENFK